LLTGFRWLSPYSSSHCEAVRMDRDTTGNRSDYAAISPLSLLMAFDST
jgi:hypothetical protein